MLSGGTFYSKATPPGVSFCLYYLSISFGIQLSPMKYSGLIASSQIQAGWFFFCLFSHHSLSICLIGRRMLYSFTMQINAPASTQCLLVRDAITATNNLYKAGTPLSISVTQSDMHSVHLSPFPLSLPRPSLQMPLNRLGDMPSTMRPCTRDCGVSVVHQQVVRQQRDPQSKRLCHRYLVTLSVASHIQPERARFFFHVFLK